MQYRNRTRSSGKIHAACFHIAQMFSPIHFVALAMDFYLIDKLKAKKLKLSHYTPTRQAGARGRGGVAPTHFRPRHWIGLVVSVTPRPRFSPGERTFGTHCTGGWVDPRAGLDTEARRKILSPLPGIEPRSSGRPARSQTLYWLSYPGSQSINYWRKFTYGHCFYYWHETERHEVAPIVYIQNFVEIGHMVKRWTGWPHKTIIFNWEMKAG
jgi:hypothetical protein